MKTAVITGASSGIGEACARLLAENGWNIFLVARRRDKLGVIAGEINGHIIATDVTHARETDFMNITHCDLLVNCAGGAFGMDLVSQADVDSWIRMFNTNVLGTLHITKLLLPQIIEAQGCIINITSTAALNGYEGGGGYLPKVLNEPLLNHYV